MTGKRLAIILVVVSVVLCGCSPDKVTVDVHDSQLSVFASMNTIDRASVGLESVPATGDVDVWRNHGAEVERTGYDASLVFRRGALVKDVFFAREGDEFVWIGESDVVYGPNEFETVDGRFPEQISVEYFRRRIRFGPPIGLSVEYLGDDPRLANKKLELTDVEPVLMEWNRGEE